jgi:hypothetical protein
MVCMGRNLVAMRSAAGFSFEPRTTMAGNTGPPKALTSTGPGWPSFMSHRVNGVRP